MTLYAILSDVHGRATALERVLADARQHGANAFVVLGDIGSDLCYDLLREIDAQGTFGNYEVSGWDKLRPENQSWVHGLPGVLVGENWLAAHAAPYLPEGVSDVRRVLDYVLAHQVKWSALFPDLVQNEHARWLALAELETQGKRVFFHGHTHLQRIWQVGPDNVMVAVYDEMIQIKTSERYIIGVGSVGQPSEGTWPCYALYDGETRTVTLRKVK